MKYKKQITTSVLALSLLMVGSSAFASMPTAQDTKINQVVTKKVDAVKHIKNKITGTVSAVSADGTSFTVTVKNRKTNTTTSFDVQTTATTKFTKDGKLATMANVTLNTKVIVSGKIDIATNTISATKVRLVTKKISANTLMQNKVKLDGATKK